MRHDWSAVTSWPISTRFRVSCDKTRRSMNPALVSCLVSWSRQVRVLRIWNFRISLGFFFSSKSYLPHPSKALYAAISKVLKVLTQELTLHKISDSLSYPPPPVPGKRYFLAGAARHWGIWGTFPPPILVMFRIIWWWVGQFGDASKNLVMARKIWW